MPPKTDGYGIHLSPCNGCYKRSFSNSEERGRGFYCAAGIWDSRGTKEDGGENMREKCSARYVVEPA